MNSLLLTVAALRMLVPRAIVAEVLGSSLLDFVRDETSGLVFFGWRGRRVPLLGGATVGAAHAPETTERIGERTGEGTDQESKIAIFHGLRHPQQLPFYGFMTTRNPRLLRVDEDDVEEIAGVPLHPAELMRIRVDGNEACIPRIDHFESTLVELMKPAVTR